MICHLYPEPSYLVFSSDVPELLYYSHIPAMVISLLVGFFIFLNARHQLQNRLLFLICLSFSAWTTANLVLWTDIHSGPLLFAWPFLGVMASLISIFSIYFVNVFITKEDISFRMKLVLLGLLSPVLIFASSNLNVTGFNLTYCDAFDYEGALYKWYHAFLGALAIVWIGITLFRSYRRAKTTAIKKQILLMGVGIELFLSLFFTMVYVASYIATAGIVQDSDLELYGLFGMIIFMVFISILIVRFRAFSVGLLSSQALVLALIVLIGSLFTFLTDTTAKVVIGFTLVLTAATGIILIRSVRKEIALRQRVQGLVGDLEKANTRLKQLDRQKSEFVSIASHQLRSPLTSIAGYASLLREGNYGNIPQKMVEPLERIEQSARFMAEAVEDFLNVSRIESGNMKYNLTDFNLRDETEHIADDIRPEALRQGLVLLFRTSMQGQGVVHADLGKVQQILHNLINNALKYTPKGTINVVVRDDKKNKRIYVDIVDTGIGMNQETLHSIFQKFERGDKANTVNVKGTGLGLYVALKMAEAMGGTVSAHSEGEGKGSRFTVELPLVM